VVAGTGWIDLGDVVRQDAAGDWWFLGRVSECITTAPGETWATSMIEPHFVHAGVASIAAIGVGRAQQQRVVLVIAPRSWPWTRRSRAALVATTLAQAPELAARLGIGPDGILLRRRLPVDVRHQAKILRGELATWATRRLQVCG
jgi:acyl-coenzyme A synthetase/AMP-(fatty) acid ligase